MRADGSLHWYEKPKDQWTEADKAEHAADVASIDELNRSPLVIAMNRQGDLDERFARKPSDAVNARIDYQEEAIDDYEGRRN